ncbi:MAG TPA: hypothetical protein HA224_00680 [Nanoarchaeota archaeon]|nr:hypothetical protein [Nanoarchaeota archaeon]
METVNLNAIYELLSKMSQKLEEIDIEVHELTEKDREIAPEYFEKLKKISKNGGKTFSNKKDFIEHIKNL